MNYRTVKSSGHAPSVSKLVRWLDGALKKRGVAETSSVDISQAWRSQPYYKKTKRALQGNVDAADSSGTGVWRPAFHQQTGAGAYSVRLCFQLT